MLADAAIPAIAREILWRLINGEQGARRRGAFDVDIKAARRRELVAFVNFLWGTGLGGSTGQRPLIPRVISIVPGLHMIVITSRSVECGGASIPDNYFGVRD
jgi:hypothetical protein